VADNTPLRRTTQELYCDNLLSVPDYHNALISREVWEVVIARAKEGDTFDDALRRVLGMRANPHKRAGKNP